MFERTRLGKRGCDPRQIQTIRVLVEPGSAAREEVAVEPLESGRFRALVTPGLAGGFAADDVIELSENGAAVVVARAGNVGVQVLARTHEPSDVHALIERAEQIGGWLDGFLDRVVVLTFPVRVGFPAHAGSSVEWFYANVYEPDGTTPIGWWDSADPRS